MKKIFNPNDWLPATELQLQPPFNKESTGALPDNSAYVEKAIRLLEASHTDITSTYNAWLEIGFALSMEFGENGRDYFHRISRFYPGYNFSECDKQYSACLKSDGSGVHIGTFFHHMKQANFSPSQWLASDDAGQQQPNSADEPAEDPESESLKPPVFPEEVYKDLPKLLEQVVAPARDPEEKDMLLLGALGTLSSAFPKFYGLYGMQKIYPNLYVFISAPPASGKGSLSFCRNLLQPLHKSKVEAGKHAKEAYERDLAAYALSKDSSAEKPRKPAVKMHFIPANNSSTGFFQLLDDNGGQGLMFENEGDTLTMSFKTEYGNFNEGFRKAFHHEPFSYFRRTENEHVALENTCLSAVLSGTPGQIGSLIPSAANGLFSRFIFYHFHVKPKWKNMFENSSFNAATHYLNLGEQVFDFYKAMEKRPEVYVTLSAEQIRVFNEYFSWIHDTYHSVQPNAFLPSVKRLGTIAYRMAMIFTALRCMEDGKIGEQRECSREDFKTIMRMISVLVKHSSNVFSWLKEEEEFKPKPNIKHRFLDALPIKFNRQDYLKLGQELKVSTKTLDRWIIDFQKTGAVHKDLRNEYENILKLKKEKRERGKEEKFLTPSR